MHKGVIASLILSVLLVIFALQNTHIVEMNLFFWSVNSSLALLVVVLFVMGALLGYMLMVPVILNKNRIIKEKENQLKKSKAASAGTPASQNRPKEHKPLNE